MKRRPSEPECVHHLGIIRRLHDRYMTGVVHFQDEMCVVELGVSLLAEPHANDALFGFKTRILIFDGEHQPIRREI